MTLPAFELHRASSVDEATDLLGRFGDDGIPIAGGTELLLLLKLGYSAFGHLIDVRGIPELNGIRHANGHVEIGAAVTHREIERSAVVHEQVPALAEMERSVANIRVRTAGTLGGNLCFCDPHSDPATFLLAAGAEVVVRRGGGPARVLGVHEFLRGPYETALEEGDLLVSIRVPSTGDGIGIAHRKLAFRERPAATAAVWVRMAGGRIAEARIAVGSVGPLAVRAHEAEALLVGGFPHRGRRRRRSRGVRGGRRRRRPRRLQAPAGARARQPHDPGRAPPSRLAMSSPPLENRTLREQVFEHLRDEILSDRLPAGTELQEVALAESLGISRGPLREALGRLAAEGLVTIRPRRGATVTRYTRQEFVDAYQVRGALESLAMRLAVPRLDADQRAALHELTDEMAEHVKSGDVGAFFAANGEFHRTFVIASGNERLRAMHEQLMGQMNRLLAKSLELRGSLDRSVSEHRAILDAVDAGDATAAARLVEQHVEVPNRVVESAAAADLFDT